MRLLPLALIALVGCAGPPIVGEYERIHPTKVAIDFNQTNIRAVYVKFSPTDRRVAIVQPSQGSEFVEGFFAGSYFFSSRQDEFETIYSTALLKVLHDQKQECSVTKSRAYPTALLFEFHYRCEGDT